MTQEEIKDAIAEAAQKGADLQRAVDKVAHDALLALLGRCLDALIWCSGSNHFQRDGMASVGWEKTCRPLISELIRVLGEPRGK